jgi:TolA-binding protein
MVNAKENKRMKTKITTVLFVAALAAGTASAQAVSGAGRDAFLKQQAVAEMQRVSAQVDVLATNQEELSDRIRRTEAMKSEIESLRAEVATLKGTIAELRREMQGVRGEIVQDLSKKIASMQPPAHKQTSGSASKPRPTGPCYEYTVQQGDTLSLIAKAFGSTVQKIKDMNGMKSDALRIGQKINVPKE